MSQSPAVKRIVVGVDFSEPGEHAIQQAVALAREHAAELLLVHATGITASGLYVHEVAGRADEPYRRFIRERTEDAERDLAAIAEGIVGVGRVSHRVEHGEPQAVLVEAGRDADLTVVGSHGRAGVAHWVMGSVAERVVRGCASHVLVAREATAPAGRLGRVLVATDFSAVAARGLELAIALAAPDATVEVLHCWQIGTHRWRTDLPAEVLETVVARTRTEGERLLAAHGAQGATLRFEVVQATAAAGIRARLATGAFDWLVLGSHGRTGLGRFLLGSVAEQSVRHAPCSVLVAHAGRASA